MRIDDNVLKTAWNNACSFSIDNPQEYKICYICYSGFLQHKLDRDDVRMKWNLFIKSDERQSWAIDHIDGNENNHAENNLVAVHCDCLHLKKKQNYTKLFLDYKSRTQN